MAVRAKAMKRNDRETTGKPEVDCFGFRVPLRADTTPINGRRHKEAHRPPNPPVPGGFAMMIPPRQVASPPPLPRRPLPGVPQVGEGGQAAVPEAVVGQVHGEGLQGGGGRQRRQQPAPRRARLAHPEAQAAAGRKGVVGTDECPTPPTGNCHLAAPVPLLRHSSR